MKTIRSIKNILCLLLAAGMATGIISCGSSAGGNVTAATSGETSGSTAETEPEYVFPTADLGGRTFTILNTSQNYSFYSALNFDEQTGDTLDDSIYTRNRTLEDKYNFKYEIVEFELDKAASELGKTVLAGDDVYDAAFLRDYYTSADITEGYLQNLDDIPELQLDKDWWDGAVTENSRIGKSKKAFIASSDISLVDFEGTCVTFFNEDMLKTLNIDAPYQLVRDGKWTVDKLGEYIKAGANLNGDENFTLTATGNCTYGIVAFQHTYSSLISGSMVNFIDKDKDGTPYLSLDNEKFYTLATKLSNMFAVDGDEVFANNGADDVHYETLFKKGRSLMMIAQLKATNKYRDMDAAYGIVPIPKYDEKQENYRNLRTFSYVMCVPVTNQHLKETGIVMDAMAYITSKDIMPYFYEGRISQKALRNDDSIEMLQIIRNTRYHEFGTSFGWVNNLYNQISDVIVAKSTDFASLIAEQKTAIEGNIKKVMDVID